MSFTVAMVYYFIHSLKVTALFLQNNNQYHKEVRPCSPYKTFSTLNFWCYLGSFQQSFTWVFAPVIDLWRTDSLICHACIIVETKVFGTLFHWKWKTIVKTPLTCWWLCQDLDKVTSDWLRKEITLDMHCCWDKNDWFPLSLPRRSKWSKQSQHRVEGYTWQWMHKEGPYVTIFFSNKPQDALAKEKARRVTGKELTSIKAK